MGLFGFGKKPIPNPYTREDMLRDISPSRINSQVYQGNYGGPLTPLSCAISYGSPSIVGKLIRNGADFRNLSLPYNLSIAKELLKYGYKVDTQRELENLVSADDANLEKNIKFILDLGADVNLIRPESRIKRSPFQDIASTRNPSLLKLLIDAGGDVNTNSYAEDESPLFEAILGCPASIALALGGGHPKIENIKLLVNAGAKANQRILELADRIGNEDVLKILRAEIGKL
jgi:hypothetical protein